MKQFETLLAKSWQSDTPEEPVPACVRLVEHLRAVELAGMSIIEAAGDVILKQLELPASLWLSRLSKALRVACLMHDLGKANRPFQEMILGMRDARQQPARHELLSALILEDQTSPIRQWALNMLGDEANPEEATNLLNCVIGAVAGHHVKMDRDWRKAALAVGGNGGGFGLRLQMLLTHQDTLSLFNKHLLSSEQSFSLVEGETGFLGSRRLRFNLGSNDWQGFLARDPEWRRFAATLKALLMAADVAGSAMAPANEDIAKWVGTTLSRRITNAQMQEVVSDRLKSQPPLPFQNFIANSTSRITLVEAGCGSGKTVAAYMWAAHHAENRKLFFCYPTTGTATEGFLGYVQETIAESKLIHSRAIVDLAGLTRVPDEDMYEDTSDHLMKIESLRAWAPQVVICTVDTVLSLVRNNRRGLYNSPAILCGTFVFDELHAYDDQMFGAVIAFIKALPGASFLLMSASLSETTRKLLHNELGNICEVPPPSDLEAIPRYEFQQLDAESAYRQATAALAAKKRVLWVCNTVRSAQQIFDQISQSGYPARTYHSRFKYMDRVKQHRKVINWFEHENPRAGLVAVTTQVAEMSLDLDADLLISEVAPIPALIQRLGRLNRRVTVNHPGSPRKAFFLSPSNARPYAEEDLVLADRWLKELIGFVRPLSQRDLRDSFNMISSGKPHIIDTRNAWLDSGWLAEPESVRDAGVSVNVIMAEDEEVCRKSGAEVIKRTIPLNYRRDMEVWREFRGHLIAPPGVIAYDPRRGATFL